MLLLIQSRNILINLLNLCSFIEIHSFVSLFDLHTFIHTYIHSFFHFCLFILPFIHFLCFSSFSIHSYNSVIHSFVCSSVHPSVHPSPPSLPPLVGWLVSFFCLFVCLFVHLLVSFSHSFSQSVIHSFSRSFIPQIQISGQKEVHESINIRRPSTTGAHRAHDSSTTREHGRGCGQPDVLAAPCQASLSFS